MSESPSSSTDIPYRCTIHTDTTRFGRLRELRLFEEVRGDGQTPLMTAIYENGPLFQRKGAFQVKVHEGERSEVVGRVESPGWFSHHSLLVGLDAQGRTDPKGIVEYQSTSRNGKLMEMSILIPRVRKLTAKDVLKSVQNLTPLTRDIIGVIVKYVGLSLWSEKVPGLNLSNHAKYLKHPKLTLMTNRRPSWNPLISAYTLEFSGRARLPSVHNFQLCDERQATVLQLGKMDGNKYNMDFGYPLSTFQAFCICVSVLQRTFVRD